MCQNTSYSLFHLTDFLIKQFFNQNFMNLKINEYVKDFIKYVKFA
jgi:hypothetical protein